MGSQFHLLLLMLSELWACHSGIVECASAERYCAETCNIKAHQEEKNGFVADGAPRLKAP